LRAKDNKHYSNCLNHDLWDLSDIPESNTANHFISV